MIILDKPLVYNGKTIQLNFYHRTHVNLIENTRIWMCFIPKNETVEFPELVISPIDFNAWEDIWRISITLKDRIGAVNDVLQILKQNSINILSLETLSINSQRLHSLELVVDARRYANTPFDRTFDERKHDLKINTLKDIRRHLLTQMIDDIHIIGNKPRIKINRVHSLYEAAKSYNKFTAKYGANNAKSPRWSVSYLNKSETKPLYPISFILPQMVRDSIKRVFVKQNQNLKLENIRYLPVSDTKDRFLRIYFFEKKDKIISFALKHQEIVGAVATITAAIGAAEFNILSCHSRVDKFGEKAITDFIVNHTNRDKLSIEDLKNKLENCLSTLELTVFYKTEISYPNKYNDVKKWKPLKHEKEGLNIDIPSQTIRSRLSELHLKYRELDKSKMSIDDKIRRKLVEQLLIEENFKAPIINSFKLFISVPNDNMEIPQIASSIAGFHGLTTMSIEDLYMSDNSNEEIKTRIQHCDFFLGIWVKDKSLKGVENKYYPSIGMILEWGIAEGNNKISKLIVEEGIDCSSHGIEATKSILRFSNDLEEQIEKVMSFFKSKM